MGETINFKATNLLDIGKIFYYQSKFDFGIGNTITLVNSSYVIYNITNTSIGSNVNSTSSSTGVGSALNGTSISSTGVSGSTGISGGIISTSGSGSTGVISTTTGGTSKNAANKNSAGWVFGTATAIVSVTLWIL